MKSLRTLLLAALVASGCASQELTTEPPPLVALEEPLALRVEPDDEAQRTELEPGGFTGLVVAEAARGLDDADFGGPLGIPVVGVVQNSPAQAAGVLVGDLLLLVEVDGEEHLIEWASEWRALERSAAPDSVLSLVLDRAGREVELAVTVEARMGPAPRLAGQRFRETDRVGVVLRTATEVEAAAAGLGPGAGAVVVGLSAGSPWRARTPAEDGVVFGDVITAVDGATVSHAQVLLDAVRAANDRDELRLEVFRDGRHLALELPVSRRAREVQSIHVPVLFRYDKQTDSSSTSILLGLFRHRRTRAAWDVRLLWLISFGGGDADRLQEVRE